MDCRDVTPYLRYYKVGAYEKKKCRCGSFDLGRELSTSGYGVFLPGFTADNVGGSSD
jgi:hypothetical protein